MPIWVLCWDGGGIEGGTLKSMIIAAAQAHVSSVVLAAASSAEAASASACQEPSPLIRSLAWAPPLTSHGQTASGGDYGI